jgi:hypothetical protein
MKYPTARLIQKSHSTATNLVKETTDENAEKKTVY